MKFAVILLSCNQVHLTHSVVNDLETESIDFDLYVVDNGGSYTREWNETIITPPENLRWAKGNNLGFKMANAVERYDGFFSLNDDIRLSPDCLKGMIEAWQAVDNAGLVAPFYDDVYDQQKGDYRGDAWSYKSKPIDHVTNLVDGTAFFFPYDVLYRVGLLDSTHFGNYGWGGDLDFNHRIKQNGYKVVATERSYINHFHQGSAKHIESDWSGKAGMEMEAGMTAKYGENWRAVIYG
jgi:GT2 family glycosyltransferase